MGVDSPRSLVAYLIAVAAFVDLLRRTVRTYPTTRDIVWAAFDAAVLAIALGTIAEESIGTIARWTVAAMALSTLAVFESFDPDNVGTPEPPVTSELGNKIAFAGGVVLVGLLIFAAIALDGWPAVSFLAIAVLLVVRLRASSRKRPPEPVA